MQSIAVKFLLPMGAFLVAVSCFILYRTGTVARNHAYQLVQQQAALAVQFDVVTRKYVADHVRPFAEKAVGKDEFIPETMSTSFVARRIFDGVRKRFPDYILKFSSDNPRNPANQAGPEELAVIDYFQRHPGEDTWVGQIQMDGKPYLGHFRARRMEQDCLRCHGMPEDAPPGMVRQYGTKAGFHRRLGEVFAMDTVAIPMEKVDGEIRSEVLKQTAVIGAGVVVLYAGVSWLFRSVVSRRLGRMAQHFAAISDQPNHVALDPIRVGGADEISVLGAGFNRMAAKLQATHDSLEQQVRERTAELTVTNEGLKREIVERKAAEEKLRLKQSLLEHLLATHERDRQAITYEIHDGLVQDMAASLMYLQAFQEKLPEAGLPQNEFDLGLKLLVAGIDKGRRLIGSIRPPLLDDLGIVAGIESLIRDTAIAGGPPIEFVHDSEVQKCSPLLGSMLFRIVQEALANLARYSRTEKARIELNQSNGRIRLEVQDWGVGFDPDRVSGSRFGLQWIRERVNALQGSLTIDSAPGRGTRLTVDLPWVPAE
ncbi:MAG: c-type heme family protein [Pirellulales bacterium]